MAAVSAADIVERSGCSFGSFFLVLCEDPETEGRNAAISSTAPPARAAISSIPKDFFDMIESMKMIRAFSPIKRLQSSREGELICDMS
jgi:hypothetical protein